MDLLSIAVLPSVLPLADASPRPCPTGHPSSCSSVRLFVCPSVHPSARSVRRPSVRPSVRPPVRSFVRPSARPSFRPPVRPSVDHPFHPFTESISSSFLPSVRPFLRLFLSTSIRPSIRLFAIQRKCDWFSVNGGSRQPPFQVRLNEGLTDGFAMS